MSIYRVKKAARIFSGLKARKVQKCDAMMQMEMKGIDTIENCEEKFYFSAALEVTVREKKSSVLFKKLRKVKKGLDGG